MTTQHPQPQTQLSVQELCSRYKIKSRKTLYSRLKALEMTLAKDGRGRSMATSEQIDLLDQLEEHLNGGGTLSNFTPVTMVEVQSIQEDTTQQKKQSGTQLKPPENKNESQIIETEQHILQQHIEHIPQQGIQQGLQHNDLATLVQLLAGQIQPVSPLWYHWELERAEKVALELTSNEVRALIGVKPVCRKGETTYRRGCWLFVKSGRIGNQTAWRVQKNPR